MPDFIELADQLVSNDSLKVLLQKKWPDASWPLDSLLDLAAAGTQPQAHQLNIPVAVDGTHDGEIGPLSFGLSGAASAAFSVDASPDLSSCGFEGFASPSQTKPVCISFKGALQGSVKGSLPISTGGFGGTLDGYIKANGVSELTYLFHQPDSQTAQAALLRSLAELPAPWSLSELASADGLSGLLFKNSRNLDAGVSLSLKKGLDLQGLEGSVSLSAKAQFALSGKHDLRLKRLEDNTFRLEVTKSKSQTRKFSGGLNVVLDLSELTQRALDFTTGLYGQAEPLLRRLEEENLLRPGTLVLTSLKEVIEEQVNDSSLREIAKLALGESSAEDATKRLVGLVRDALDIEPDIIFSSDTRGDTQTLLAKVFDQVPFPALAKDLETALLDEAIDVVLEARETFEQRILDLGTELLEPLAKLGVSVQSIVENTDAALEPVRSQIEKYSAVLKDFHDAASSAANKKFDLSVQISSTTSDGAEVVATVELDPSEPYAQQFHAALFNGNATPLSELISGDAAGAPGIRLVDGTAKKWSETVRESQLGLTLFGNLVSASKGKFGAKSVWTVSTQGNITVQSITSAAEAEAIRDRRGEFKAARFDDAVQIALSSKIAGSHWKGSFELTYEDKRLTEVEFLNLLDQLSDAKLIGGDERSSLTKTYDEMRGDNFASAPAARFKGSLSLTHEEFEQITSSELRGNGDWLKAREKFTARLFAHTDLKNTVRSGRKLRDLATVLGVPNNRVSVLAAASIRFSGSDNSLTKSIEGDYLRDLIEHPNQHDVVLYYLREIRGFGMALTNLDKCFRIGPNDPLWSSPDLLRAKLERRQLKISEGLKKCLSVGDPKTLNYGPKAFSDTSLALIFSIADMAGKQFVNGTHLRLGEFNVSLEPLPTAKNS